MTGEELRAACENSFLLALGVYLDEIRRWPISFGLFQIQARDRHAFARLALAKGAQLTRCAESEMALPATVR